MVAAEEVNVKGGDTGFLPPIVIEFGRLNLRAIRQSSAQGKGSEVDRRERWVFSISISFMYYIAWPGTGFRIGTLADEFGSPLLALGARLRLAWVGVSGRGYIGPFGPLGPG